MVRYNNLIKAMGKDVITTDIIQKAIRPTMEQILPRESLKKEYGIPEKMPYTDEEYDADLQWYENPILEWYRKYIHKKGHNSPMVLLRTDGITPRATPSNGTLLYPNGETIEKSSERFGIRNEILLRSNLNPYGEDIILPDVQDLKYQALHNIRLLAKISKDSMTLTKLEEEFDPYDTELINIILQRDKNIYNEVYNEGKNNGFDELWKQLEDKTISFEEIRRKMVDIYAKETNTKLAKEYTIQLNTELQKNNIPLKTYYINFKQ